MKIYISAGFDQRERMRGYRDLLWSANHDVVSSWLDECPKPEGMPQDVFFRKLGLKDLAELCSADLVLCDFIAPSTTGGRDVEFGFALARHQRCQLWMVGVPPRQSPFHLLADRSFPEWSSALAALGCYPEKTDPPIQRVVSVLPTCLPGGGRIEPDRKRPAQSGPGDALGEGQVNGSRRLHPSPSSRNPYNGF